MKIVLILIFSSFCIMSTGNGIKVVYKSTKPENYSEMIPYKKVSNNHLDRGERILKEAEKELVQIAKEKNASTVEIFVLQQKHGELPTESQFGSRGYVELLYILKNIN